MKKKRIHTKEELLCKVEDIISSHDKKEYSKMRNQLEWLSNILVLDEITN